MVPSTELPSTRPAGNTRSPNPGPRQLSAAPAAAPARVTQPARALDGAAWPALSSPPGAALSSMGPAVASAAQSAGRAAVPKAATRSTTEAARGLASQRVGNSTKRSTSPRPRPRSAVSSPGPAQQLGGREGGHPAEQSSRPTAAPTVASSAPIPAAAALPLQSKSAAVPEHAALPTAAAAPRPILQIGVPTAAERPVVAKDLPAFLEDLLGIAMHAPSLASGSSHSEPQRPPIAAGRPRPWPIQMPPPAAFSGSTAALDPFSSVFSGATPANPRCRLVACYL